MARSIQVKEEGSGSFSYTFRPVLRLNDRSATGAMRGRLVDEHRGPLSGVKVLAQEGEEGERRVVRTVLTASDGTFRVDRLSVGHMYYLVAQPRVGDRVYRAQASEGFKPGWTEMEKGVDFPPFQPATEAKGLEGVLPSPATPMEYPSAELRQHLTAGTREGIFIIQTALGTAEGDGSSCKFHFSPVAAGTYRVLHLQTLLDKDGFPTPKIQEEQEIEVKGNEGLTRVDFPRKK